MNILIFRAGHLGDTLIALPAMRMIRAAYPQTSVYLIYPKHLRKAYIAPKEQLEKTEIFSGFIEHPFGESFFERMRALLKRLFLIPKLRWSISKFSR